MIKVSVVIDGKETGLHSILHTETREKDNCCILTLKIQKFAQGIPINDEDCFFKSDL